jgi:hypothetical protein
VILIIKESPRAKIIIEGVFNFSIEINGKGIVSDK